jgi:hypothetical protein
MAESSFPLDAGASPQAAEAHYLKVLGDLVAEAYRHRRIEVLADVMCWTLARMVLACGVGCAGDVLRRFGDYLYRLDAQERARQEAVQAAQNGHVPH